VTNASPSGGEPASLYRPVIDAGVKRVERQDAAQPFLSDPSFRSGPGFGGCGKTTIIADPLEQFIAADVLHRLESPRLPEAIIRTPNGADGSEWQAEVERTQAKLDELAELGAEGTISRGEWLKARAPIERRQTLAKKKPAALNRATALVP
jgi:site-specific DNA recombinase